MQALVKRQAIIEALQEEAKENTERLEYLESINILLERAIKDLKSDLGL